MDLRSEIRIGLQSEGSERATELADKIRALTAAIDQLKATSAGAADLGKLDAALQKTKASQAAATQGVYDFGDAYEVVGLSEAEAAARLEEADKIQKLYTAHLGEKTAAVRQAATANGTYTASAASVTAADQRGAAASASMEANARRARMGVLDVARASQDFSQGGFAAIVNNLEGLGRGIPAMLANPMAMLTSMPAILTIAGVAILELVNNWDTLTKAFGDGGKAADLAKGQIVVLEERIKALQDLGPTRIVIDQQELEIAEERLKEIKESLQAFERMKKTRSHYEKESGKQFEEIVSEATEVGPDGQERRVDGDEISRRAVGSYVRRNLSESVAFREAKEEQKKAEAGLAQVERLWAEFQEKGGDMEQLQSIEAGRTAFSADLKRAEEKARAARKRVETSAGIEVGRLFDEGTKGNEKAQKDYARLLAEAGLSGTAQEAANVGPKRVKADEESERAQAADLEKIKESAKRSRADAKLGKDLTEQGRDNQREADEARDKLAEDARKKTEQAAKTRAGQVAGGAGRTMEDGLVRRIELNVARGVPAEEIAAKLARLVERDLREQGQGDASKQAADDLVRKAMDKAAGERAKIGAQTGGTPREAAARHLREMVEAEEGKAETARKGTGRTFKDARQQERLQRIAQGMSFDYGMNDQQAMTAAPQVASLMDKEGMNPVAAGQLVYQKMAQLIEHQNSLLDGVHAQHQRMTGLFEEAFQHLQMLGAGQRQTSQDLGRIANDGGFQNFNPIGG